MFYQISIWREEFLQWFHELGKSPLYLPKHVPLSVVLSLPVRHRNLFVWTPTYIFSTFVNNSPQRYVWIPFCPHQRIPLWPFEAPLIEAVSLVVLYQTWPSIAQPPKHQTRLLQLVFDPSFYLCRHYFHHSQPTLIQISSLALRVGTSSIHLLSFLYGTTRSLLKNLTCFPFLFFQNICFLMPETQQCHLLKTSPVGSGSLRLTTVIKEATAVRNPY